MRICKLLRDIMKMDISETNCFKITNDKFLYVENFYDEKGNWFTILELNEGREIDNKYELEKIIEIVSLDYKNKKQIKEGLKFMLSRCKKRFIM